MMVLCPSLWRLFFNYKLCISVNANLCENVLFSESVLLSET